LHFRELDQVASSRAPRARHLLERIVLLQLIASAAGLTVLSLEIHGPLALAESIVEMCLLGVAFFLTWRHHRAHQQWMKTRIEAEICRSFLAVWPLRQRLERLPRVAIQGFDRLMRNLRLMQLLDPAEGDFESARKAYLDARVQTQIDYYSSHGESARKTDRRFSRAALIMTGAATVMSVAHVALSLGGVEMPWDKAVGTLTLVLPLVGTALVSLILSQEHSRRAHRYQEMTAILKASADRLKAVRTWRGLAEIATETEQQLLNEAVEWQSFIRFASEPH
jgi:SMODS and SLOG-associating 2TM effector domain 1